MKFLQGLGKTLRSTGRTIGNIGNAIKTVANNSTVRTIANAVGSVGSKLLPLAAPLVAAQPELGVVYGAAQKGFSALKSGSALNTAAKLGSEASNFGNKVTTVGANFT